MLSSSETWSHTIITEVWVSLRLPMFPGALLGPGTSDRKMTTRYCTFPQNWIVEIAEHFMDTDPSVNSLDESTRVV